MNIKGLLLAGVAALALPVAATGVAGQSVMGPLLGISEAQAADSIGAKVAGPLKAAQELSNKGDFAGAFVKAKEANAVSGKSAYETYVVSQFLAFLSVKQKDYSSAAQAYGAMLDSGKVPSGERGEKLKTTAQLYYQAGNATKASQYVKQYQTEFGNDADLQALVSQGYYQAGDFKNASMSAKDLVAQAKAAGRKPQEAVLQIWLASAFKLGDKSGQREALTGLVGHYPSATYWGDLLDVTQAELGHSDRLALEVFRLRMAVSAMQGSDDYMEMAQMAIQNGLPGEAQSIMEKGFANKTLGGANKSRETRLLTMAKTQATQDRASLSQTAATPKAKAALGEAYATYGNRTKAIELYKAALSGAEKPDEVKLHLGQAYLASGNKGEAQKMFGSISKDPNYKALAALWLAASGKQTLSF